MAKKSEMQHRDLPYQIDYRNIKYPRLEFKTGSLLLILPKDYEDETTIVEKHKDWISRKQQTIRKALEEAQAKDLILTRTESELRTQIHSIVERYLEEFNFNIDKVYFRKMKTKWASYSPRRNLTANTLLKHLPKELIEYVIFHELTHSMERKHNARFWKLISKRFENHKAREMDLLVYWFLVQKFADSSGNIKNPRE